MLKPNILFILIDSMRSDRCYGKNKITNTPNIDSLIQKGVFFKQAISSSDYTITGYGSIFTGLFPINAGISGMSYHKIFSKVPNYIGLLQNYGYHTYATMDTSSTKLEFSSFFENDDQEYDRTKTTLFNGLGEKILKQFDSIEFKEPWFYFIHIEDLHIPVQVPEKFMNKKYSERYDFVVENIDFWLGKFLKKIDLKNTILILTADHGDYILSTDDSQKNSLNQKIKSKIRSNVSNTVYDFLSSKKRQTERKIKFATAQTSVEKRSIDTRTAKKRYLFDDVTHIPFLMTGAKIPHTGIVSDMVRNVDIFPTIGELIGLPKNPEQIDGRSLLDLLNRKNMIEEPAYLENTIFATDTQSPIPCIGIRTSNYKYFREHNNIQKNIHLYDLRNDPLEENNLADENQNIVKKMEKLLSEIREKLQANFEETPLTDEETKKIEAELKKLGYI
jgi:arylsulfatase A-like enzyme